jgi:hypothetical protein
MRKSIRWILFALAADSWQRDRLTDKDKKIKRSMRKSILLNVSSSKTIARFEAKFDVTTACFFVVVCYRLLICAFTDQCWFISTVMIRFKSVYCMWSLRWMMIRGFILSTVWWSISNVWITCSLILFGKVTHFFIQFRFQAEFDLKNFNQKFEYRQFAVLSTSDSDIRWKNPTESHLDVNQAQAIRCNSLTRWRWSKKFLILCRRRLSLRRITLNESKNWRI